MKRKSSLVWSKRDDADVAHEDAEDAREGHVDLGVQVELHGRLGRVRDQVAQEDPDDHAEINGRDRLDPLPRGEQVAGDDGERAEHQRDEDEIRIGEVVLADDLRHPDGQAGDDQHEGGPDDDQQHDGWTSRWTVKFVGRCPALESYG